MQCAVLRAFVLTRCEPSLRQASHRGLDIKVSATCVRFASIACSVGASFSMVLMVPLAAAAAGATAVMISRKVH